jgi:oxygen-independent coproporphyrinogen-3 oxidase
MPAGLYISVPFCRTKCSYCNFASDVFSGAVFKRYVDRVCADMEHASKTAEQMGGEFERAIDSVYLGGGTPTILAVTELQRLFVTVRQNFDLLPEAEITVECAPGTLTPAMVDTLAGCGVNRVSLGVQSYIDAEAAAVGRLHQRSTVINDIAGLRLAGISNINVDVIAGLPHQSVESWQTSLDEVIASGVPHVSVYMLEVDEDSRLGRELIAGGTRYHAHFVPDEDLTADLYTMACERLNGVGVAQYEISNFAHSGGESRHNLKYWTRQPYLGFGVDAHSMLPAAGDPYLTLNSEGRSHAGGSAPCELLAAELDAVRFATPDSLEGYVAAKPLKRTPVARRAALEEEFFLGLRLTRGVDLRRLAGAYGPAVVAGHAGIIDEMTKAELLERNADVVRLTSRGRLLSNLVFEQFLSEGAAAEKF